MPRESIRNKLTRGGACLAVVLTALCLLAAGSPALAATHVGIFGGFGGGFPGPFINGGTAHAMNSQSAIHFWSSTVVFDVDTKEISGEGPFSMVLGAAAPGDSRQIIQGTWKARRLTFWQSIGLCRDNTTCSDDVGFPDAFNAGKMRARISLFDGNGDPLGEARLTIWCSLPGIPFGVDRFDPDGRGIETFAVRILTGRLKGRNFLVGRSGTVFIDLSVP